MKSFVSRDGGMALSALTVVTEAWSATVMMIASEADNDTCKACKYRFDDLTGTVLVRHHQQVSTWILGSYFMGVNLSNRQIAHELGVCESDAQAMTEVLRYGIVAKKPEVVLSGDVEFDEFYVVAGHKGNPEAVRAKGREGRRN